MHVGIGPKVQEFRNKLSKSKIVNRVKSIKLKSIQHRLLVSIF